MNHLWQMSQQTIRRSLHTSMNHLRQMPTTTSTPAPFCTEEEHKAQTCVQFTKKRHAGRYLARSAVEVHAPPGPWRLVLVLRKNNCGNNNKDRTSNKNVHPLCLQ